MKSFITSNTKKAFIVNINYTSPLICKGTKVRVDSPNDGFMECSKFCIQFFLKIELDGNTIAKINYIINFNNLLEI